MTSRSFHALQPGRSINGAGFVAAVLKSLGYIRVNAENSRLHAIKSCDILQPGPAALVDGLEQLHLNLARCGRRRPRNRPVDVPA